MGNQCVIVIMLIILIILTTCSLVLSFPFEEICPRQAPIILPATCPIQTDTCPAECPVIEPATCPIQTDTCPVECPVIEPATCPICPVGCPIPKIVTGSCLSNNEFQSSFGELHGLEELDEQEQQIERLGQNENSFTAILRREPLLVDMADGMESNQMYGSSNEQNFGSSCDIQEEDQGMKGQQSNFIHAGTPINTVDKEIIKNRLGAGCGPVQENMVVEPIEELLKRRRIRKVYLMRRQIIEPPCMCTEKIEPLCMYTEQIEPPCMYTENCNLEHNEGKAHGYQEDYEDMSGCQTEGFSNCNSETGLTFGS
ncbi:17343_t:CDS:2 [Cetraspora pellucida]|uniref:17343_t:CDS:1 n=1 Tax=Cetraspora pellucida TaxID=1433469 RepID=A0A9N9BD47_9GLOM|nr:17343_t:CDS:2 [Cetraspora pellucida]